MSDWAASPEYTPPAKAPETGSWEAAPLAGPSPQQKAVVSANDNGDDAGKALKIAKQTGIPAPVVASDIPSYDAHARTQSAIKAVENPVIANYIDGHPMAPKVSGDDYEKLDEVSQFLRNLHQDKVNGRAQVGLIQGIPEIVGMLGSAPGREKLYNALTELPHALSEGILDFFKTPGQVYKGEVNLATPQGLDKGISMGIGLALGGSDIRLGKVPTAPGTVGFDEFMSTIRGMQTRAEMDAFLKSKAEANSPPDALLQIEKAKAGADALDGAVEAAQESKTKIRSPDMFEEFAKAHGDSTVHLPAETVAELYAKEGKAPAEGDGLLGFIPDLPAQVERGLETGGEISVPLSKYLAHVDPSVHEGLREDVRLHDDGVTLAEAREITEQLGQPEKVAGAAVRLEGQIYTGILHSDAIQEAYKYHGDIAEEALNKALSDGIDPNNLDTIRDTFKGEQGFVTSTGRFISRKEALELAEKQNQIQEPFGIKPDKNEGLHIDNLANWEDIDYKKVYEGIQNQNKAAPAITVRKNLFLNQLFTDAKTIGLTDAEFKKYSDKIEAANASMIQKSIERDVVRRTSADWKAKEAEARAEIETQLAVTGPYAAQKYIKENKLELTPANADMLAPLFGYDTGAALIKGMEKLPEVKSAIDGAVKELMEARYGNRRANVAQEARELALSDDWHGILADEVRILAKAAGVEPALSKDELVKWSKDTFEQSNVVDAANWEKLRRAVEKGGREAEKALLKGDFLEAFKAKQRQMLAATVAKESIKLQKVIDSAEKKLDRFASEETIKSIDQSHLEQIRQMLASVGVPQQFAPLEGTGPLRDFVAAAEGQIAAAPWLMDGTQPKLKDMTVEQFRGFVNTMKSLEHVGRMAMTVENARGKAELQNVVFGAKKELARFPFIDQPESGKSVKQRLDSVGRKVIGLHLLLERMFDYTDQFNPHGPITEWLDRPLRDSNTKEIKLTEQVTKMLRELKPLTDASVNELIDNTVIPDAKMKSGLMQMDRGNMRQLMLNMGNETNIKKAVDGFNVPESAIWDLINANATAKDWKWVQGVWDVFAHLKPEADAMQLRDTGVPVDSKVPRAISNVHGEFAGGYYPIVYDRTNSDIQGHMAGKNPIFAPTYVSATTPHGYTEAVTGYKGALDLSGSFLASRLQGMVHDIAFREAIRNANKLISNQEFSTAIMQHWGKEYADLMLGWLKDIANSHTLDDNYAQGFVRAASIIRQNVISTLVAFNPGTFIKHGFSAAVMSSEQVGGKELLSAAKEIGFKGAAQSAKDLATRYGYTPDENFMQAFRDTLDQGERGDNVRKFIMDSSAVMRNRQRKYDDSIRGAVDAMNEAGYTRLLANGRQNAMLLGRMAVAFSDGMSAMPTWYAAYKEAFTKGETHADAVFIADKAMSRAHGSSFIGDQPLITRLPNTGPGELGRWFTPLYKFWNHRFNSYVQLAWDAAATARGPIGEAPPEPGANAASIAKRLAAIMALIYIEENATAALDEDKHGLMTKTILATVRHFGGGLVGLREVTNGLASGYEPSTGMLGVMVKAGTQTAKDINRSSTAGAALSKSWLIHSATTVGVLTGVGGTQPGKTISFLKDLATGREQPRTFNEYRQGLRTGHSQARKF